MPRRSNPLAAAAAPPARAVESDGDDGDIDIDVSSAIGVSSGGAESSVSLGGGGDEVLRARAREFLDLNRQIKEAGAQVAVLRKNLKAVEKSLMNCMLLSGKEELELDGAKIVRTKKLELKDE